MDTLGLIRAESRRVMRKSLRVNECDEVRLRRRSGVAARN